MLLFQLNDIGVSLAGGMSPLMVLVQQGSQITQMYAGQGGVNAALRQTADLAKGAVAGLGRRRPRRPRPRPGASAADRRRRGRRRRPRRAPPRDQRDRRDPGLLRRRDAGGLAEHPRRRGRPGEAGLRRDRRLGGAGLRRRRPRPPPPAWDGIVAGVHVTGNAIIKAYGVVCETIGALFAAVPSAVGAAVVASANAVLAGVEWLINRVSGTLNDWIGKVNDTLGMLPDWMRPDWARIPTIPGDVSFGRYENPYAEDLAGRWRDYTGAVGGIVRSDPLGDVFRDVSARAEANARARAASAPATASRRRRAAAAAAVAEAPAARRPRTCGRSSRPSSPASTRSAMRSAAPTRT